MSMIMMSSRMGVNCDGRRQCDATDPNHLFRAPLRSCEEVGRRYRMDSARGERAPKCARNVKSRLDPHGSFSAAATSSGHETRAHKIVHGRRRRDRRCDRRRRVGNRPTQSLRPLRSRRAAHVPRSVERPARSRVEPRRALDRVFNARRHLESSGRRRRSNRADPWSELLLRAGVESRRPTHRAHDGRRWQSRVGIVDASGGDAQRVASHARVDLEPTWSRDGQALYFASARNGGWRIFRHDLATGADTALANGIQPSVSPDGRSLAYEQNGLRVLDLSTLASRVVREEEAEYRVKPVWTPDGKNILYVTEDKGSNDIRIISAAGGDPIELTIDTEHHEMSPSPSPDGKRFAFVAFRAGVPTLYTADIAGGRPSAWREVKITSRRSATPTGRLRIRVVGPNGRPMPARVYLDASDGRSYTPNGLFHRAMMVTDRHYFHTAARLEVDVPVGRATVEALRGWEYTPKSATIEVRPGVAQHGDDSRSIASPISPRAAGTRATTTCTISIRDSGSRTTRSIYNSSPKICTSPMRSSTWTGRA